MSHKKNPWLMTNNMMDVPLEFTPAQKYLGVEITSSLDWSVHINAIATKPTRLLGFFEDTLSTAPLRLKRSRTEHS